MGALVLRTERHILPPLQPTPVPFCTLVISLAAVFPFLAGPALSTLSRALFFNATEGRRSYGAGTAASDSLIPPPPPTEAHFPYVPSRIYHRNSRLQEPFRGISREGYYTDSGDTIDSLPVYSVEPRSDITDPYYINSVYPSASTNNHRVIIGTTNIQFKCTCT